MTSPCVSISRQRDAVERIVDLVRVQGARRFGIRETEFSLLLSDAGAALRTLSFVETNEEAIRGLAKKEAV